jgi:ribonuclease HII
MEIGSDEAGKGPVLGPMVVAAVGTVDRSALPDGVDDSKTLSRTRRDTLAETLRESGSLSVGIATIPVDRIDDSDTDMNTLAVSGHARAIDEAVESPRPDSVTGIADACDTSAERFTDRVTDACRTRIDLDARHGADGEDALVAAASIIAKVTRDEHIAELNARYDHDVGSGYPSDPTTRQFLEAYAAEHGTVPPCARRSWSTCEDVLAGVEQAGLEDF